MESATGVMMASGTKVRWPLSLVLASALAARRACSAAVLPKVSYSARTCSPDLRMSSSSSSSKKSSTFCDLQPSMNKLMKNELLGFLQILEGLSIFFNKYFSHNLAMQPMTWCPRELGVAMQ